MAQTSKRGQAPGGTAGADNSARGPRRRLAQLWTLLTVLALCAQFFASALPASAAPGGQSATPPSQGDGNGGQRVTLLVKFKPGTSASDAGAAVKGAGAQALQSFDQIRTHSVTVPANAADAVIAALGHNPNVESVSPTIALSKSSMPNDPNYGQQWALPKIAWDQAYGSVAISGSATIAVLDTGVDASHPDLADHMAAGISNLNGGTGGNPNSDPNGHGTALAGIAAASVNNATGMAGVAYAGARIAPVQVLGADGSGSDADVVAGVLWAADHGANVILMGFSSPDYSQALADAVSYAEGKGAVLVAATGNASSSAASYPAGMPGVLGVAASDQHDALVASSNTGSAAVAAPGAGIEATQPGGGYTTISGTSAAAAEVAGLAALLSANGTADVAGQIRGTVDPLNGSALGRINVAKALGAPSVAPPPNGTPTPTPAPTPPTYEAASTVTVSGSVFDASTGALITGTAVTITCTSNCSGSTTGKTTTTTTGIYGSGGSYTPNFSNTQTLVICASASGYAPQAISLLGRNGNGIATLDFHLSHGTGSCQNPPTTGSPAKLVFITPAQTITAGMLSDIITVQLQDAGGNPIVPDNAVTVTLGSTAATGTFSSTIVSIPTTSTSASFKYSDTKTGTPTITASGSYNSAALTPAQQTETVVAAAASKLVFGQQPSNANAGATIAPAVTVSIQDQFGNLTASTASVTLAIDTNPSGGTLSGTKTVSAVAGVATFSDLSIDKAGTGYTLAASSSGLTGATSNAFNINQTGTNLTAVSGSGTYGGSATLTATLKDTNGNPLPGKTISFSLNGTAVGTTATTDGSGVATLSSVSLSGIDADVYHPGANSGVTATFAGDAAYSGSAASGDLTVNRANQSITFAAIGAKTFGDADFDPGAMASSGLAVSYSVGASDQCTIVSGKVHITGAGSCTVTASQEGDGNYNAAAPVSQAFTINPATATFTLGDLNQTYDASPKSISVMTNAASYSVTYQLHGSSDQPSTTPPTGAGTYDVVVTSTDPNYSGSDNTHQLVIAQAGSTTAVVVSDDVYDGNPHGGSATVTGAGGLSQSLTVTYTGRAGTIYSSTTPPTNAGAYTASASYAGDANHTGSGDSKDFTISPAQATITITDPQVTYDGDGHAATIEAPSTGYSVTYTLHNTNTTIANPTNAGTYDVTVTMTDPNYSGSQPGTLTIKKANAQIAVTGYGVTYDGNPHTATGSATGAKGESLSGLDLSGTTHTGAGSYTDTWTFTDSTGNYNDTTGTVSDTIGKATPTIAVAGGPFSYDGDSHAATVSVTGVGGESLAPSTVTYVLHDSGNQPSDTAPVNAGTYDVAVTFDATDNYAATSGGGQIVINQALATITIDTDSLSQTYDGSPKSVSYGTTPGTLSVTVAYDGSPTPPTAAGDYAVVIHNTDPNYAVNDATATLHIAKATPVVSWTDPADITYGTALSSTQLNATANVAGSFAYTPDAGTVLNAGSNQTLSVVFTPDDSANYNAVSASAHLNVNKADAAIVWSGLPSGSQTYGATFSVSASATSSADVTIMAAGGCTLTGGTVTMTSGTVACSLSATAPATDNYNAASDTQTIQAAKATLTVTPDGGKSKTYGDIFSDFTGQVSGAQFGDQFTVTYASDGAAAGAAAGSYGITVDTVTAVSPATLDNYTLVKNTAVNGLTVNPKALTITASSATVTYGDDVPTISPSYAGFVDGDDAGNSLTTQPICSTTYTKGSGVSGSPYPTSCAGAVAANYSIGYSDGTVTVSAKALTITAGDTSKQYGQAVTFDGTEFSADSLVNGDTVATVSLASAGAVAAATVAGSPYPIVPSDAVAGPHTDLNNYAITYANGTLAVTPAPLTVTPANASKTYGDANPTFSGAIDGIQNGDNITATYATTAAQFSSVGNYDIAATLNDPDGKLGNYTVTLNTGTLKITQRAASVTAVDKTKNYGGANPELTATVTGTVNGDSLSYTLGTAATDASDVGNYPITVTLGDNPNYDVTSTDGTLTITARPITVTADAKSKVYGDADPALTYKITAGSLAFSDAFAGGLTRATGETVGHYAISQGTLALNDNYALTFNGADFEITKAPLTVTVDSFSRTYGEANPALSGTVTGVKNGDNITATYSTPATETSPVASYPITATLVDPDGRLSNYDVTATGGTLQVTPALLTVTADDKSRVYGDANPSFRAGYSGFKNGETLATSDVTGSPDLTTGATLTSPVGNYPITAAAGTLTSTNYTFTFANGTLQVTKATLTITPASTNRVYGDDNSAFSGTVEGAKNGESFSVTYATSANAGSPVGDYDITVSDVQGDTLSNYDVVEHTGTLTVTPAPLTVTPANASKTYGDANPTFSGTIDGIKNNDDITASYNTTATEASPVGAYAITAALTDPDGKLGNYDVTLNSGTLTINQATVHVDANPASKTYGDGDPIPAATLRASDFKNSDTATTSGIVGSATCQIDNHSENVSTYSGVISCTAGTLSATNYSFVAGNPADLTIDPRPITVTADSQTKVYGDADPALTYQVTGTLAFSDAFTGALSRASGETVGSYAIQQGTLALSSNYSLSFNGASLTITPRPITVTADAQHKNEGDSDPALTYKITSGTLVNGDTFSGSLTRDPGETVGAYAITQGTLMLSGNYTLTYVGATLTIANVAPSITGFTGPTDPIQINTLLAVNVTFTDPGKGDDNNYKVTIDWGDGKTDTSATYDSAGGSTTVQPTHQYAATGVYTLTATVTDGRGMSSPTVTLTTYIVIYDPNGGFVTGGGWINSPAGAYLANPSLTGKATFGFVSKYQKGAKVPTGNTEFQFQAAGLNFHSENYQWLVVSGAQAQYKGTGTINGAGTYGFLLTAGDGQVKGGGGVDTFRVKIWKLNADGTDGPVVYDNLMGATDAVGNGQPISGGSIVIHN
ncbi:MAG TPA: MBG domain-containing protein [Thermomicrobiaceae bacterium]|nr:MBG domain-containing protein [Thermomicrobiaceae bacterium]